MGFLGKGMILDSDHRVTSKRVRRVDKMRRRLGHCRQVRCNGWYIVESARKRNEGIRRRETVGSCRKIMQTIVEYY